MYTADPIPDGFAAVPDLVNGDCILAFRQVARDGDLPVLILVRKLGGTLPRNADRSRKLPNPQVTIFTEKWGELEIEVARVPQRVNDIDTVNLNAMVPLTRNAVQLTVFGETAREVELKELLKAELGNLSGETNWLTEREWDQGIVNAVVDGLLVVGVIAIGIVRWWKSSAKKEREANS